MGNNLKKLFWAPSLFWRTGATIKSFFQAIANLVIIAPKIQYKRIKIKRLPYAIALKILGKPDYASEISYWEGIIMEENTRRFSQEGREKSFPKDLLKYIEKLRKKSRPIRLLEVGSGPISTLGWGVEQRLFEITAIDPLADEYEKLMQKFHKNYPIKPINCTGEKLLEVFEKESFDIAYSLNALDHTVSPKECFENMYGAVKKGGIIYVVGGVKIASSRRWCCFGLHQHDLTVEENQLIHYDKNGTRTNLTQGLKLCSIASGKTGEKPEDVFKIIFKKL